MSELTQNDKTKNSRLYDFKILRYKKFKVLNIYLKKCLFLNTVVYLSGGHQLKTTKWSIRDFMI